MLIKEDFIVFESIDRSLFLFALRALILLLQPLQGGINIECSGDLSASILVQCFKYHSLRDKINDLHLISVQEDSDIP